MKTNMLALFALVLSVNPWVSASAATLVVDKVSGTYQTIQEAVNAANEGDTIYIRNGIYDVGETCDAISPTTSNRVYITKALTLVGESKEGVIIKGKRATINTDSDLGCGTDAVRCLGINADNVVISNLTITGGATQYNSTGSINDQSSGGGVYVAANKTGVVIADCIISNNVATQAGAVRYATDSVTDTPGCTIVRSWLHENKTTGANPALRGNCLVAYSLLTRHYSGNAISVYSTYVNCTFADAYSGCPGTIKGYNCIFADEFYKVNTGTSLSNCLFNAGSDVAADTTNEYCSAKSGFDFFMAPPLVDYRLHSGATTAIKKGNAEYLNLIPEAWRGTDFYGYAVDTSSVNLGCAQEVVTATGGTITFAGQTGMTTAANNKQLGAKMDYGTYAFNGLVMGSPYDLGYVRSVSGTPKVVKLTHDPTTATKTAYQKGLHSFTASGADTTRRYARVDGVFTFTTPADGTTLTLAPAVNTTVLYVDASSTATTPDGSATSPYATLSNALEKISLSSGQYATVYVAAGTYDQGTMTQSKRITSVDTIYYTHKARAVVPERVSVVGAGADKTFIVGADDPDAEEANYGCGANAVRCVALFANSHLAGFTLTGGRTDVGTSSMNNADDFHGGGVLSAAGQVSALAWIEDCVISNCVARRGGGGYNGIYNRVQFFENRDIQGGNGAAMRGDGVGHCFIANCLIDRNYGSSTVFYPTIINCTFGADNVDNNGNSNGAYLINTAGSVTNTLILGVKVIGSKTPLHNCVYSTTTSDKIASDSSADDTCVASDALTMDADYSPTIGSNEAVDKADLDGYDIARWGIYDVYGNPRRMNGLNLDVGAVEANWTNAYSKVLKKFTVTAADPEVELVDEGLKIPAGASLTATVGRTDGANLSYALLATVSQDTQCFVTQDGCAAAKTLSASVSSTTLKTDDTGFASYVFTTAGTGSTILTKLTSSSGFMLFVR